MPDAPATDFRPVILGGDITAYSLVRTFHAAYGVRPLVVNMTDGGPIGMSRLCDHVYVEGFEDADVFVGALEKVGREHATPGVPLLLVAAGDWYVRMIIEHKDHLGQWFTIPYIDLDLLDRIVRKDVFYGLLDEVGVPYPTTVVVDMSQDLGEEHDLPFEFPVVMKPADSALHHYARYPGKKKVFIHDTREQLDHGARGGAGLELRRQLPSPGVHPGRRHQHAGAHLLLRPARQGALRRGRPRAARGAPPDGDRQPLRHHQHRDRRDHRAGHPLPRARRLRRASPTSTSSTTAATAP